MEQRHKDILTAVRTELLKSINARHYKDIIDGLYSKNILTLEERNELKQGSDQLRKICDTLPTRGKLAFETFIQVLVDCGEQDAAEILRSAYLRSLSDSDEELPEVWPNDDSKDIYVTQVPHGDIQMNKMFHKALKGKGKVHAMHSSCRGIFLLIDNEKFEEAQERLNIPEKDRLKDRTGTKEDARVLTELFNQLHFRVVKEENLSAKGMMDAVQNQLAKVKATDNCFACAVLSHGNHGVVYGVEKETVDLEKLIQAVMHCPRLDGKPKIFFIQACQGSKGMSSTCGMDGAAFSPEEQSEQMALQEIADKLTSLCIEESDKPKSDAEPFQPKSDVFVAIATIPDFVSFRNTTWGTRFVQAVACVFSRLAHKYHISDLMMDVNRLVGRHKSKSGCKQVPAYSSSLTKKVFFFPGLKTLDD